MNELKERKHILFLLLHPSSLILHPFAHPSALIPSFIPALQRPERNHPDDAPFRSSVIGRCKDDSRSWRRTAFRRARPLLERLKRWPLVRSAIVRLSKQSAAFALSACCCCSAPAALAC